MTRPICTLCRRTGSVCSFPTVRKPIAPDAASKRQAKRRRLSVATSATTQPGLFSPDPSLALTVHSRRTDERLSVGEGLLGMDTAHEDLGPEPQLSPHCVEGGTDNTANSRSFELPDFLLDDLTGNFDAWPSTDSSMISNLSGPHYVDGGTDNTANSRASELPDVMLDDLTGNFDEWPFTDSNMMSKSSQDDITAIPFCDSESQNMFSVSPVATDGGQQQKGDKHVPEGVRDHDVPGGVLVTLSAAPTTLKSLVDIYFDHIHAACPIIHRQRFEQRFSRFLSDVHPTISVPVDEALLLYGIMALAARFSNLPAISRLSPDQRGHEYASRSGKLIANSMIDADLEKPSLTFLHGCTLAAVYWLASRPNGRAWTLVGFCVRIAHALSLDRTDVDFRTSPSPSLSNEEWVDREELRRAWWLVVECDTFASVIHCRPLTISRARMHVLLPSQDAFWLGGNPVTSAFFDTNILSSWKNLTDSSNRNPHAWYLLVNQLMVQGHELSLEPSATTEQRRDLQDAIQYAAMSLPPAFGIGGDLLCFEEDSIGYDNWVIAIHVMMQSALTYAIVLDSPLRGRRSAHGFAPPARADHQLDKATRCDGVSRFTGAYRPALNTLLRVLRRWAPEFCASSQPFQVCTLLGPYAAHLQATFVAPVPSRGAFERDLIRSVIARIANHWGIGRATLGMWDSDQHQDCSADESVDLMDDLVAQLSSSTDSCKTGCEELQCLLPSRTPLQTSEV
ncbi:hypothetical protein LTR53_010014 [Teratosphaeriaceae sp. CCFEE 6253]|nr:hypothetical protein LTR53_010014 [Teratosphaeriaceae sp. CCFEE 6253]